MPGLESAPQRAINVPVGPLATSAEAVVTPNAVAALSDAFRKGIITSDDIISRYGDLAKTKEKAELMSLGEAMSPEQQAARKQGTATSLATGQLGEQTALQGMESLKNQQEVERLGPIGKMGIEAFKTLGPEAGVFDVPALSNGKPDWATMSSIGLQLSAQKVKQAEAQTRLKGGKRILSADGTVSMFQDAYGEILPQKDFGEIDAVAKTPLSFGGMKPGSVQTAAPQPQAPAASPASAIQPAAQVTSPVTSPVVAPAGQPVAAGISMGPPAAPVAPAGKTAEQIAQELIVADSTGNAINKARGILQAQNTVGPVVGSFVGVAATLFGAILGIDSEEQRRIGQRELEITSSEKILEGAQKMKGNLSDKDIAFLKATIPKLSDDEAVWTRYLNNWERANEANKRVLRGELPKLSQIVSDAEYDAALKPPESATPAAQYGPTQTAPDGRQFRFNKTTGKYTYVTTSSGQPGPYDTGGRASGPYGTAPVVQPRQ